MTDEELVEERGWLASRIPSVIVWVVLGLLAYQVTEIGWAQYQSLQDRRLEDRAADEIFEYFAVNYVGRTRSSLVFTSDAAWYEPVDEIQWVDRLFCDDQVYSSLPNFAGPREPEPRTDTPVGWNYTADIPDEGEFEECYLEARIVVRADGRTYSQVIESGRFAP